MVRQRRETDALPPVRQVSTLDAGDSKAVGEGREGLRVSVPEGPFSRLLFRGERAIPALLVCLGDTGLDRCQAWPPPGGRRIGERLDEVVL